MSLSLGLRTSGSRPRFSAKQGKPQARQQLQSSGLIVEQTSNRFAFPLAYSGFSGRGSVSLLCVAEVRFSFLGYYKFGTFFSALFVRFRQFGYVNDSLQKLCFSY